jgi:hypothetical protein
MLITLQTISTKKLAKSKHRSKYLQNPDLNSQK